MAFGVISEIGYISMHSGDIDDAFWRNIRRQLGLPDKP